MKLFRWKAIVPLTIVLVLIGVAWWLYSDRLIEHSIEDFGADLVGARVDVEEADLSLAEGRLRIVGIAAANPNSPMRNLFEAREIVADIRTLPLLRKKLLIEQVSVRGVRFGTERTESGELDDPNPQSGQLVRTISGWADRVRIPPLNLEGLNTVVNVAAIAAESLTTYRHARSTIAFADSTRVEWEAQLRGLNPKPLIDSAQALVNRLNNANPLTLGVTGATADVALLRSELWMSPGDRIETGAEGRGHLRLLEAERYHIWVHAPGYQPQELECEAVDGEVRILAALVR